MAGLATTALVVAAGAFAATDLTTGFAFVFAFGLTTTLGAAVDALGAEAVTTGLVSAVAILTIFLL
jgi:hypothetical protein